MAKKSRYSYNLKSKRRRYVRTAEALINKAEAKLAEVILLQNQLRKAGVLEEGVDVQSMKEHLHDVRKYIAHNNFTYKQANKLKEFVKDITRGNLLTKSLQVRIARTYDAGMVQLPADDEIMTYGKIQKLQRLHAKNPAKLSDKDYEAISQIANALNPYFNAKAKTTQQMKIDAVGDRQIKMFWGIGGDSTLINDLAYSLDAVPYGRKTVEEIMKLMTGDVADKVEALYRTTALGIEIKKELDGAVGAGWYESFRNVAPAIKKLITMVQRGIKLEGDTLRSIDKLEEYWERIGEEGYEET